MKWRDGPVSLYLSNHEYYGIPELGYPAVRAYDEDGRQRWSYIHRLNAIAWFFDPAEHDSPLDVLAPIAVPDGDGGFELQDIHIHHDDSCPLNNSEANLERRAASDHNGHTSRGPTREWYYLWDLVNELDGGPEPPADRGDARA